MTPVLEHLLTQERLRKASLPSPATPGALGAPDLSLAVVQGVLKRAAPFLGTGAVTGLLVAPLGSKLSGTMEGTAVGAGAFALLMYVYGPTK